MVQLAVCDQVVTEIIQAGKQTVVSAAFQLVRLSAQGGDRNLDISAVDVISFFINRCKQKLHILLCLIPVSALLRARLQLYPSLVNCCTIDWFVVCTELVLC